YCPMKSQLSIEFLVMSIFALITFIVFVKVIIEKNNDINLYRQQSEARKIADTIAASINQVYEAGDGTTKAVNLPYTILGESAYTMVVTHNLVEIKWNSQHLTTPVVIAAMQGSLHTGSNTITYENETIYLN
ncbi:MAG: hypothetical protein ABIG95_07155, partial [Candidatus Woesearchaeota archaeon]